MENLAFRYAGCYNKSKTVVFRKREKKMNEIKRIAALLLAALLLCLLPACGGGLHPTGQLCR